MKKNVFLYLCVLALSLTACNKEEVIAPVANSGKAIGFGTVLESSSRGSVFTTDALKASDYGFRVSAYNQGTVLNWGDFLAAGLPENPDFMGNVKVSYDLNLDDDGLDDPVWGYSPPKYWPGKVNGSDYGRVTFFALSGVDDLNTDTITYNTASHWPEFNYTTLPAATDQADLVADVAFDRHWGHVDGNTVKFTFKHILSKIGFKAKVTGFYPNDGPAEPNDKVMVTSLKVVYGDNAVRNTGTYAFNTDGNENGLGTWATDSTFHLSGDSGELISDGVRLPSREATVQLTPDDSDKFLMLIPQVVTTGALTVELTYTISQGSQTVIYPITYPIPAITYEIGKQYTYVFELTTKPVVFDVDMTVGGWGEDDGVSLPL
jgi:hypothetical protein